VLAAVEGVDDRSDVGIDIANAAAIGSVAR
jgi:hypothetical protein